jgi:competence ComEA-like helix-hairpin-helix protein
LSGNFFKEYFFFPPSARRGLWILIILIIIVFTLPHILPFFINSDQPEINTNAIAQFDSAFELLAKNDSVVRDSPVQYFNPNKIDANEWVKYGASKQLAKRIENYIQKKGHFRKSEEVLKIYGFDSALFKKLSPFFKFDEDSFKVQVKKFYVKKINVERAKIELNSTDSAKLEKLPFIGPVLSARIVKYRNKLGGFYDIEQLKEVYGLKEETFEKIKDKVYADTSLIIKLDLNNATELELRKHPYIGKYKASLILKYRKFKGHICSLEELSQNSIFSDIELEKLRFYFK